MSLESIFAYWTHCYHITADVNLHGIRHARTLFPALTLFRRMAHGHLVNSRRTHDVQLRFRDQEVLVRNQAPLDPDQLELGPAETFQEYVASLNSHVFFWPGTSAGPTSDGTRMLRRSAGVRSAVIRIPTRALLAANADSMICVSTCNTGASWDNNGRKSTRGIGVFQPAKAFSGHPGRIEEILFRGSVNLPDETECSADFAEAWRPLFALQHGRLHVPLRSSQSESW